MCVCVCVCMRYMYMCKHLLHASAYDLGAYDSDAAMALAMMTLVEGARKN